MLQCVYKTSTVNVITKTERSLVFVEKFPRNYISRAHTHKNKETFHVAKGRGVISCDDVEYEVEKGMTFVVEPFKEHRIITEGDGLELLGVIEGSDTREIMNIYWGFMMKNQ